MIVEILCGGYGCPTKTGIHTVAHGLLRASLYWNIRESEAIL